MMTIAMTSPKTSATVMGILNVTPDSFYDGGKYNEGEQAVAQTRRLINEGANIIDIGGESTGPRSKEVSLEEELQRVLPVVDALRDMHSETCISVDTYKAEVASQILAAGATMINDVTAGRGDRKMFRVIAESGCRYIMMRSKDDSPRTTMEDVSYNDVLDTIHAFFEERISAALKVGIAREQLILDPGLGHFVSSDPAYSWYILEHLEFLCDFGCPILVSPSRKSFTAEFSSQPPEDRLAGTLRATEISLNHGASIVRTHDVRETCGIVNRYRNGGSVSASPSPPPLLRKKTS